MIPPPISSPGHPTPADGNSGVQEMTKREARIAMEAWGDSIKKSATLDYEEVAAKARVDSLRVLIGSGALAVGVAFGVFFALDSRADTKDAGVAAQAAKDLATYAKYNDARSDRFEAKLDKLADGVEAIGRKLKVRMPRRDAGHEDEDP